MQSLVAMALLQSRGGPTSGASATIFAIEEPEAHLNSEAIYKLRKAIIIGAQSNQVILTTHSPIFAFSGKLSSNIIVRKSVAEPAKNMPEIREALGVKVPENLTSAGLILLCEGKTDCEILQKYLRSLEQMSERIESGFIKVEELRGVQNLPLSIRMFSALSCEVVALVDGDLEARDAGTKAVSQNYISEDRILMCSDGKRAQVEFEDLFEDEKLGPTFRKFGLVIDNDFVQHAAKFSQRVKNLADRTGVLWSNEKLVELKVAIQKDVCAMPELPLKQGGTQLLERLSRVISESLS